MIDNTFINSLNSNTYMVGLMMLLLNLGGKYLSLNLTKSQEDFLSHVFIRYIVLFAVVFIATRNILTAVVMMIVFIILVKFLLNESSRFCVIPKMFRMNSENSPVQVSDAEIENAKRVLDAAKRKKEYQDVYQKEINGKRESRVKQYKSNLALIASISHV